MSYIFEEYNKYSEVVNITTVTLAFDLFGALLLKLFK